MRRVEHQRSASVPATHPYQQQQPERCPADSLPLSRVEMANHELSEPICDSHGDSHLSPNAKRFMNSRKAPGTPAGSSRKKDSPVYT